MKPTDMKPSEAKEAISTVEAKVAELVAANEAIVTSTFADDAAKDAGVDVIVTDEMRADFAKNTEQLRDARKMLEFLRETVAGRELLDAPDGKSLATAASAAAFGGSPLDDAQRRKSVGELFVASDEFKALQGGKAGLTMAAPFELAVPDLGSFARMGGTKDVYTELPSGSPGSFGTVTRDPMVERARRRIRVRDLFAVQQTNSRVIEYFRVTGFTNNASVVPERIGSAFGTKPQSTLTFEGETATVRTIAHWEAAHRSVLADEPQLRGVIDTELLYGLQLHEDYQILRGTGAQEDLEGILNVSGVQTYSQASGPSTDNKADALRRAMTLALLAYYDPTGIVLHDSDMEDIELAKSTTGEYLFLTALALGVEPRVHRLPVVTTPAMTEGTALVGSFGIGAQLYDREEASIRISESHSDFFVRNAIVILAEQRLALATKRPESFVNVTFS